jgi:LysR family hydrogen peroxide-inducible transcriptional activator
MELHQLRYFVAVAELRNFTRAAEQCLVAQPSLSQQIAKLEKSLGKPLFERSRRGVTLTEAGKLLYEQATTILTLVEDARESVGEPTGREDKVRIGAIPTIAPYLLPKVLRDFRRLFPQVRITVHEDLTAQVVESCLRGEIDLGLVALPVLIDSLAVEVLFREELLMAIPAQHPLARKKRVTVQQLAQEPFVLLSETHCLGEHIVSFCREKECPPSVVCRSTQLLTVQELVGLGQGLSLIPAMAASVDKSKRCVYRSLAGTRPLRSIAVIWNKHRRQSPPVKAFVQTLRQQPNGS